MRGHGRLRGVLAGARAGAEPKLLLPPPLRAGPPPPPQPCGRWNSGTGSAPSDTCRLCCFTACCSSSPTVSAGTSRPRWVQGNLCWGHESLPAGLATAEEKKKRQASRSPAISGVQPRLGVGRGTRADEGRRGCGVRLGSLSVGPPLSRGGLQRAKVGAPQPGLPCCGPFCPAPCATRSEAACSKWRVSASALQLLPELCWRLSRAGPHSSWGQEWGQPKAGEQEINRLSLGLSQAPAFQLVTPLSPAPSNIHRSPQRCNRAGGRRYRNALRVPGQRSHLILAGDSVVVP